MSKVVPIGMDIQSTQSGGYIAIVCCSRYGEELQQQVKGERNLLSQEFNYCPFCGERL